MIQCITLSLLSWQIKSVSFCIRLYILAEMKTKPIPTRFETGEIAYLSRVAKMSGLNISEIVRRSVRLMRKQVRSPRDCHLLIALV